MKYQQMKVMEEKEEKKMVWTSQRRDCRFSRAAPATSSLSYNVYYAYIILYYSIVCLEFNYF